MNKEERKKLMDEVKLIPELGFSPYQGVKIEYDNSHPLASVMNTIEAVKDSSRRVDYMNSLRKLGCPIDKAIELAGL